VSLLSSLATTTTHGTVGLRLVINNNRARGTGVTTAHLAAHRLEELASLLAGHELELAALATSNGGRVTGRAVEGDKSFRGSSRHSVLYTLEEKFLRQWG